MVDTKYESPSPEDILTGHKYAFTVNPNDHNQFWMSNSGRRVQDFAEQLESLLRKAFRCTSCQYLFKLELSKRGRLHGHGWLTFPNPEDIRDFYLITVRKLEDFCTYVIKEITTDEISDKYKNWKEYVLKQSLIHTWIDSKHKDDIQILKQKKNYDKFFSKVFDIMQT